MFCRECGKNLIGIEDFCPMCGTKVIKEQELNLYDQEEVHLHNSTAHQELQEMHQEEEYPSASPIHSESDGQEDERHLSKDHANFTKLNSDGNEANKEDESDLLKDHPHADSIQLNSDGQENEPRKEDEHDLLKDHPYANSIQSNSDGQGNEPHKEDERDLSKNHPYANYSQSNSDGQDEPYKENESHLLKNHPYANYSQSNSDGQDEPYKENESHSFKNHPYANYIQSNSIGQDEPYKKNENHQDHAEKDAEVLPVNEFNGNDHAQELHGERENFNSSHEGISPQLPVNAPFPEESQYNPNVREKHAQTAEAAPALEANQSNAQQKRKPTKKELLLTIGIPAASLLLFTGTALAVQSNEKNSNQKAEALHYEAEEYALDGSYDKAVEKLSQASKIRPENSVIKRVKVEVESALKVEKTLSSIEKKIDEKEFGEAKDALNSVRNDIQTRKSPIFVPLETKTSDQETELVVEMVKTETAEMDTVDEIGEQLKKIISLKTAEAEEAKGQLIKKIVAISQKTSEEYMKKKNFDEAIKALRSGLKYTNYENAELTSRLSEIEDEKLNYAGSLPVFLEQHWLVINSKSMRSKTPPLVLQKVTFEEDQFTYVVTGQFKNMTKSVLNNPTIYLKIYDKNGKFLFNDDVSSKEVSIKGGQTAEFFFFLDKEYGKEVKVVMDQVVYRK